MTHGHGLLRIGDRTKNATLPFDSRHTVILQRKNPIVHLIVKMRLFDSFMLGPRCSLHSSHVSTTYLVYTNIVCSITHTCFTCQHVSAKLKPPVLGQYCSLFVYHLMLCSIRLVLTMLNPLTSSICA